MLATEYAKHYGIEKQRKNESDQDFRLRVSNALRAKGKIIEAQEAYHNRRYEDGGVVMDGMDGEIGRAMGKVPQYSREGTHNDEGDKIAAGSILRYGKDDPDPMLALLAALLR